MVITSIWSLPSKKKPDQIQVVFDSSTEYQGKSLNSELLTNPDLTNNLIGVLIASVMKTWQLCVTWSKDRIIKETDMGISETLFYKDSKVILGYICNERRRFHIKWQIMWRPFRKTSSPNQWRYIESSINPADLATLGLNLTDLSCSHAGSMVQTSCGTLPDWRKQSSIEMTLKLGKR